MSRIVRVSVVDSSEFCSIYFHLFSICSSAGFTQL